jgi:hypothetical protein
MSDFKDKVKSYLSIPERLNKGRTIKNKIIKKPSFSGKPMKSKTSFTKEGEECEHCGKRKKDVGIKTIHGEKHKLCNDCVDKESENDYNNY